MNIIHRDLTIKEKHEKQSIENSIKMLKDIARQICEGKKYIEDYDEETQKMLNFFIEQMECK